MHIGGIDIIDIDIHDDTIIILDIEKGVFGFNYTKYANESEQDVKRVHSAILFRQMLEREWFWTQWRIDWVCIGYTTMDVGWRLLVNPELFRRSSNGH